MQQLARWLRFNLIYLGQPPWDTGISPPELIEFIQQHPPGRAIDLGCGTGTNLLTLGKAGWQVTGVDFALKAVNAARRKLERAKIPGDARAGSVARLETVRSVNGGLYDLILDIGCYHGLTEEARASYRQNLPAILSPGGYFLVFAHWRGAGELIQANRPIGITQADLAALQSILDLEDRRDSLDRKDRPAAWLRFRSRLV